MRCLILISIALLGCSGGGVSTTARGSFGDTDDMMPTSTAPVTTDPSTSGEPVTTSGMPMTTAPDSDSASDSGMPMSESGEPATDTAPMPVMLEGAWLSDGENVAPILVESGGVVSVDAVFADGTFTVTSVDDEGNEVVQGGVYSATASGVGEIYEIVLEQSSPQAITVEGIYEIDNSMDPPMMTYEVVQTMPSVGAVPPTAEGGFGSTALGPDLTQRYVRL